MKKTESATGSKKLSTVPIPVLGFAAWSGTGKTTLLRKLLPLLKARGLRIGVIKHAHHQFDIDTPGKDSYELRKAGADQMLIASDQRWALMVERDRQVDLTLEEMLARVDVTQLDMVLVEGFRHEAFTKIELHRPSINKPLLFPDDLNIIAIATDSTLSSVTSIPVLDLNQPRTIAEYIIDQLSKNNP